MLTDLVCVEEDLLVGEADSSVADQSELHVPVMIFLLLIWVQVRVTINFYDQECFAAIEIKDAVT